MAYCTEADLVLGDIPTPSYLNVTKVIDDAADEIDSKIGYIYTTPVNVSSPGPLERPARLLLKRINAALATGRLILAVASPEEKSSLHAYGYNLVREANGAIRAIVDGEIVLEGATLENPPPADLGTVMITNVDSESQVEAFYDRIANPDYSYTYLDRAYGSNPDSLVD